MNFEELETAATAIRKHTGRDHHHAALVLGSGLSEYAGDLPGAIEIPYGEIPGFPVPRVEGHAGSLYSVEFDEGGTALVFAGRVHYYEGWPFDKIVFGVRSAVLAGCSVVVLTNAAGGVNESYSPGDLVLISDHLNLTATNPLMGQNDKRLGPRFPDLTDLCAPDSLIRGATGPGAVEFAYRLSTATSIYGGSTEIMRSLVAEASLGMPRSRS